MKLKKISCFSLFLTITSFLCAQSPDSTWVYKVDYQVISPASDSGLYNTQVYIDLNKVLVADSSTIILKVGYVEGSNELYHKEYLFAPSLYSNSEVSLINDVLRFDLGEFVMPENKYPTVMEILMK